MTPSKREHGYGGPLDFSAFNQLNVSGFSSLHHLAHLVGSEPKTLSNRTKKSAFSSLLSLMAF